MPRKSHLASFLLGAGLTTALAAWGAPAHKPTRSFKHLDVFAHVLSYVENNYVDEIDERKLVYGAVKGMMHSLDPHSAFMTPEEFADMRADTDGEFGGVGIEIDSSDGTLVVIEPIPGSPAARAGLQAGDRVVAVDGQKAAGHDPDETAAKLRGKAGTQVTLEIERKGWDQPRSFKLTRDIIHVQAVESMVLEPGMGYLKIKQFQERTDQETEAALNDLKTKAGGKLDGLILDLRGNPGGLLDQSVRVADLFLDDGVIVTTIGRGGRKLEEEVAHGPGTWSGFPIVLLVNGGTASASEIVAGALQDHGRAVVVGTQTFGKGSVQSVAQLEDGSGLKITVARYYTPNGRSIQEKGITPDLVVEQLDPDQLEKARVKDTTQRESDLDGHLANPQAKGKPGVPSPTDAEVTRRLARDYQLQTGYQTLRSYRRFRSSALTPERAER